MAPVCAACGATRTPECAGQNVVPTPAYSASSAPAVNASPNAPAYSGPGSDWPQKRKQADNSHRCQETGRPLTPLYPEPPSAHQNPAPENPSAERSADTGTVADSNWRY